MQVEIWSDVVCPWCYIGKRRFEKALAQFAHAGEVEGTWRSFQLNPEHPKGFHQSVEESLARKYGGSPEQIRAMNERVTRIAAEEGLQYDFSRYTVVNTFDAHRMTHLAKAHGLGTEAHERLLRAQLVEGEVLDDPETLVRLTTEIGVPEEEARRVAESDAYTAEVEADLQLAREFGITGVPFFVIDRKYGISGAQPTEVFLNALETIHREAQGTPAP